MSLLHGASVGIMADERLKDSEDMAPVFHNAFEEAAQLGHAFGFALPLGQNSGRNFDVAAQGLSWVAT